jgi:hypothetical protein
MKLENTMSAAEESAVQNLLSEIAINYCSWSNAIKERNGNDSDYRDEQSREFAVGLYYEVGVKYIKIIDGHRHQKLVWGFVVRENNKVKCTTSECYFEKGDLLKAATYKQASRNFSRGNILKRSKCNTN